MKPWRPAEGRGQGGGASESEGVDIVRPGHFYNLHLDYKMGAVSEESVFRLESSRILSAEVGKGDRSIVITAPPPHLAPKLGILRAR